MDKITDKGVAVAVEVLEREGFLSEAPTGDLFADCKRIDGVIDKYVEASREKGDARTEQEKMDAALMFFFKDYIQELLLSLN